MTNDYADKLWIMCLATAAFAASPALGGDLNPSAGPVAPTMKTLQEIEPRVPISSLPYYVAQSGSYYLTRDLTGVAGSSGITIGYGVDNVTIDLNGFSLIGVPGSGDGVTLSPTGGTKITVRNGRVTNWGNDGVHLYDPVSNPPTDGGVVEDVTAANNGRYGIVVRSARILRCIAMQNGSDGINGAGAIVSECASGSNAGNGFQVYYGSTVTNCSADGNSLHGFYAYASCVIRSCTSYGQNAQYAVAVDGGCQVVDCSLADFIGFTGGIHVGNECHVVRNQIKTVGCNTGIRVTGFRNRIEGNHVTTADCTGIECDDVTAVDNLIISNSLYSAPAFGGYQIGPGNSYGPVVDLADGGNLASIPNASHPWANFLLK